jgi:hypothetical protein
MNVIGSILASLAAIGSLVCLIMMLIPLFKEKGVLHLILGIICALYTFIWGWMNADRLNKKNIMIIWSACILVSIVGNVLAQSGR